MVRSKLFGWVWLGLGGCLVCGSASAWGAVTATGNLTPSNPLAWTASNGAIIGDTANGSVTVNGGSSLSATPLFLGNQTGVVGVLNVDGAGSKFSGTIGVGVLGSGVVSVTHGGSITGPVGNVNVGTAMVEGVGSTWTATTLSVGYLGTATLSILDGATASSVTGQVGFFNFPLSTGIVTVAGAGSSWSCSGSLTLGATTLSNGTLNI